MSLGTGLRRQEIISLIIIIYLFDFLFFDMIIVGKTDISKDHIPKVRMRHDGMHERNGELTDVWRDPMMGEAGLPWVYHGPRSNRD